MNRLIRRYIFFSLALSLACFSCGSDDDDDDATTTAQSGDCIVTNVVLGSLKCVRHTTSSTGEDSTYTVGVTGANFPMYIDQINQEIYNADSLPVGTDLSKITFSTFAHSGKSIVIRNAETDVDITFSTTDSTDFTSPRLVTVNSKSGTMKRTYTVKLNVHKEAADSFRWQRTAVNADIASLTDQRLILKDGVLYDFGTSGSHAVLLTSRADDGANWTKSDIPTAGLNVKSVQLFNGKFYSIAGTQVVTSEDGINWTPNGSTQPLSALVANGTQSLFGIYNGSMLSSADGINWSTEELDEVQPLPETNICGLRLTSRTYDSVEDILVGGMADGNASLWRKTVDLTGTYSYPWNYFPITAEIKYPYLAMSHASLMEYDQAAMLVGLETDGTLSNFYLSRDRGRTWKDEGYAKPNVGTPTSLVATADNDSFIWLLCGGSGEVWKGRLNRLGWDSEPTVFRTKGLQ